jgi:hypothetical protein
MCVTDGVNILQFSEMQFEANAITTTADLSLLFASYCVLLYMYITIYYNIDPH